MIQRLPAQPDPTDDYSLAEETAGELHDRLVKAEAELAEMKAGMVNRVGQRFVDGFGSEFVVVGREPEECQSHPWLLTDSGGNALHFSSYGEWLGSSSHGGSPRFNLVGPAPDEAAEAKAEAQRQHDRVHELLGSRLSEERFAKLLNDPATSDALIGEDVRKLLEDAIAAEYVPPSQSGRGPEDGNEGWFRGAPLGNGRYARDDSAKVAFALPKEVRFSQHDVEFVATRIDSAEGDAVIYEVERM
jgi:hypothetical protein